MATWNTASVLARLGGRGKRTYRYTWLPDNWLTTFDPRGTGPWGTQVVTVGCPGEFRAVRLVFANIAPNSYEIGPIKVSPSNAWGDYVNPEGWWEWYNVTSAGGGKDSGDIVFDRDAPSMHTIPANTNAERYMPALYFTDWCPLPCEAADPATNMRVLTIRLMARRGVPVTFTNGMFNGYTGTHWTAGYDYFIGGNSNGVDHVANPDRMIRQAAEGGNLVNGSLIFAVQFIAREPGIQGMNTGDSHHSGGGTDAAFCSYMMRLNGMLRQQTGGGSFGFATAAHGGSTTEQYMDWLRAYLPFVQPTYCVLPGWSFNDHSPGSDPRQVVESEFWPRLMAAGAAVAEHDAIPIFLTPFPRDRGSMTPELVDAWLWLRDRILELRRDGAHVVDATAVLGNRVGDRFDGTYLPGMSNDQVHPNDAGHGTVAEALVPVVRSICGV